MFHYLVFTIYATLVASPPLSTEVHPAFPYRLDEPNAIFELPESLKEISGLSLAANGSLLAAVNDEDGTIFLLDKNTCEIIREIEFWDEGDYEGIEVVGNDAYVIKSSGTMYYIADFAADSAVTVKIKSFLNKENDVEGLAHCANRNCLFVGCKGKSVEGEYSKRKKAVFQFDISNSTMVNEPAYLLTLPDIQEYLAHISEDQNHEKFSEYFSAEADELKFSPSGISFHPITGNIYVTSSKGKMLLVLSQSGEILHLVKLKKKIHAQPEGICFDMDGTLYIANEGKNDRAVIYKFLYQK